MPRNSRRDSVALPALSLRRAVLRSQAGPQAAAWLGCGSFRPRRCPAARPHVPCPPLPPAVAAACRARLLRPLRPECGRRTHSGTTFSRAAALGCSRAGPNRSSALGFALRAGRLAPRAGRAHQPSCTHVRRPAPETAHGYTTSRMPVSSTAPGSSVRSRCNSDVKE